MATWPFDSLCLALRLWLAPTNISITSHTPPAVSIVACVSHTTHHLHGTISHRIVLDSCLSSCLHGSSRNQNHGKKEKKRLASARAPARVPQV